MAHSERPGHPEGGIRPEDIPIPDVSKLITEDDTPVDNLLSEKQMRLLTEPLFSNWSPPDGRVLFLAANVGVFPAPENNPLVPDVFLSLDTAPKTPMSEKKNRSYFVWEHGKPPDVVIEVVSNREGGELSRKLRGYERMRISHYIVYDPWRELGDAQLTRFEMHAGALVMAEGPFVRPDFDLSLVHWTGRYEGEDADWLRWARADGTLIPTGAEATVEEKQRAEQEKQRAEQEKQRAEQEKQRAEQEKQRAEASRRRADELEAKLRALGIDPDA
ncbi:MAG: Uma2 family endonuclease [Myxococcota bacterium]